MAKDPPPGYDKEQIQETYVKALVTRYNVYEVVSAFHKELRRGDHAKAFFWAVLLSAKRGYHGTARYLLNIIYEETRDHKLAINLIELNAKPRDEITLHDIHKHVALFCFAVKKWELPHRVGIFKGEMLGYAWLVKQYGKAVAKGSDIIPSSQEPLLSKRLLRGFKDRNMPMFQSGLKGLQKLKPVGGQSLDNHRIDLFNMLMEIAEDYAMDDPIRIGEIVTKRLEANYPIGYHELNAIGDALMDETYNIGLTPPKTRTMALKVPFKPIEKGFSPSIPLYAQDNHTYKGKALLRQYSDQLAPGAHQSNLDFRMCGAYYGVAWRTLAYDQFESIDVRWGEVKWDKDISKTVSDLWY